eukprot:tig00001374_g8507.t1
MEPFVSSPLGAVPKKHSNPVKYRRIHDLSYPKFRGQAVNDGISVEELHYRLPTVEHAIRRIVALGPGAELGKDDIVDAFKLCPVRPADWGLLGYKLPDPARPDQYEYYFDIVLPFGGRSSPRIFEDLAQVIDWAMRQEGFQPIRFVDDILSTGRSGTGECAAAMAHLAATCADLGVPLSPEKRTGPTTCLVFLGILLDTLAMEARLPPERLAEIQAELARWARRRSATRHELESLIGKLSFAAAVVPPGQHFLQRLIAQAKGLRAKHHRARLGRPFAAEVAWWQFLLASRHGVRLLPRSNVFTPALDLQLETDACTTGFGAVFGPRWLYGSWADYAHLVPPGVPPDSMPWKELMALIIAAATWGPLWARHRILFRLDCEPMVNALKKGRSPQPAISALIRTLYALSVLHSFEFTVEHIDGVRNRLADALSRGQIAEFRALHVAAAPEATVPTWPTLDPGAPTSASTPPPSPRPQSPPASTT